VQDAFTGAKEKQIADYIASRCAKVDILCNAYTRQLTLPAEYRAALIHECVTGQLEVPSIYPTTGEDAYVL